MYISARQFEIPETAAAFGIPAQTIHSWRRRDYLVGHRGGGVRGKPVHLSFHNAMEIGIAHALLSAGIPDGGPAFVAARDFAHGAHGPIGDRPRRLPGLPFHHSHGDTFFHVAAATGRTWEGTDKFDTLAAVKGHLGGPVSFVTVDASAVFYRLCAHLRLHPLEVLDEEYKEGSP